MSRFRALMTIRSDPCFFPLPSQARRQLPLIEIKRNKRFVSGLPA
jgi:hypothetical protein